MSKFGIMKKILSFIVCSALSLGIVTGYSLSSGKKNAADVAAKTIAEIQEEKAANEAKIAEYQQQLNELSDSKEDEEAYQQTLQEQISLIKDNIAILNTELDTINSNIETANENIDRLDQEIIDNQAQIDEKVELFKQRLCAMYVSSDNSIASVVLGDSSFYDIMSRVEMANRMAAYDDELINDILADIETLNQSKEDLNTERLTLEMQLDEQAKKKEEKDQELNELNEKMQLTQDEIDRIAREQELVNSNKKDLENANAELEAAEAAITAEIERQAAAAQAAYEAEQRRIAQEAAAERQRQAQAEAAAAAAQQSSDSSESTGSSEQTDSSNTEYTVPAPSASGFSWPAPGFCYISSPYGYRWGSLHRGIDIGDGGIHGGAAVASKSGTVIAVCNSCTHDCPKSSSCGCGSGYGNYVIISHDGTYSTLYGHLASASVSVGDYVSQGQVIGYIGCTGFSTGDHLHFEVRVNGVAQDPLAYVSP